MVVASETVALLAQLVAEPSLCGQSNEGIIALLQERLSALPLRLRRVPGDHPDRASLIASLGPEVPGGIILSAHTDVVPVAGQNWSGDPFALREQEGRLLGRGATDMKGFVAAMVTAAERAAHHPLKRPLHLAFSHDEEIGCLGVRSLLRDPALRDWQAMGAIIGEPTGLRVATGHKGKLAARATCHGTPAHSADPDRGCNAIGLAAAVVREIEALQVWLAEEGRRDAAYGVPHSTAQVGLIAGGTALNIVPDHCRLDFEFRLVPGEEGAALLDRLRRAADAIAAPGAARGLTSAIAITEENAYPGLSPAEGSAILALAKAASGHAEEIRIGFGTEAGLFQQVLGLPAVVCGPGSIDRAHKADEFITRDELADCDRFLDRVVASLCD